MTTAKARKLLGYKYKGLSDTEVQSKISSLGMFVDVLVDAVLENLGTISGDEKSHNISQNIIS